MQRKEAIKLKPGSGWFFNRFDVKPKTRPFQLGYVYGRLDAHEWDDGYIKVGKHSFKIHVEMYENMEMADVLEVTFTEPSWNSAQRNIFRRTRQTSFRGFFTYPSWLAEEQGVSGIYASFYFKRNGLRNASKVIVWEIRATPPSEIPGSRM